MSYTLVANNITLSNGYSLDFEYPIKEVFMPTLVFCMLAVVVSYDQQHVCPRWCSVCWPLLCLMTNNMWAAGNMLGQRKVS